MAFKKAVAPPFVKSAAAPVAPKAPAVKKPGKKKVTAGPQTSAIMGQMLNGPPGVSGGPGGAC